MPEIRSMTTRILIWLFSGVSTVHLIAFALIWVSVFIPGKLGFKEDRLLRICTGLYLGCEAIVTLMNVGEPLALPLTYIGGIGLFFGLGRLIRWLVFALKARKR